ncbi:alanyl-tRNA synthetase [Trichormus variabilis ATCC 29413]|uniref:Alanine--tRNA ligase n=2 Tax=Anabaena variabilis TaxID=264691 RepID=SYA_TRIV2|nr:MULTISPECIES: alanine--tRNA ligase [Nostocaceae]Q3MGN4.1 RecName: Full=Alanine--tRNA ligase; AltName: Full=Alanyl-tRNA synthetase; Short=AlaRS [Trichormus variabilis ATCC 29413]ABA19852.1 alanyl-tRNA synthetase [Trichormus variabilis ATCC 29413]MBC1217081.1 alanine--tRNA ligase [Trichormus variabilis ARAD]MBC1256911.1 alanine--tRNA ligase [Trichormus variabilis V5]MBC1269791.1 alanine--tRNA ligase [Trichormus variabilis FSR]MBC1305168.1 alanine--tRNA ligase [Trichormus variabilis N2B]
MSSNPQHLSGNEIRTRFLDFYAQRGHQILASASLVPEDPTVLLTIAGMLPFKPIFLGQRTPEFKRATTSQKCIRTNDIENVGRTKRHQTFFEMLGNFSFGDYFKEQAIAWGWEISTEVFGLPKERLVVSVFEEDDEAYVIWRDQIGVTEARIKRMGADDNFWVSGPTGPCGPCSEIYYDFHPERGDENIDLEDDTRFIEFYNLVFMQYNRDASGNLTPLQNKNIDTGMGLERITQILQQVPNNYETDLIFPIIETAAKIAGIDYHSSDETTKVSLKVIGDHVRSVVHMIADEIRASNVGRGYVLRRLIRRVVRHGRLIGISGEFINQVAERAIALSESAYPNVRKRETVIKAELEREEANFLKTLDRGEKLLEEIIQQVKKQGQTIISGESAFTLYDTYGFPLELTQEIAEENNLTVDEDDFNVEMQKQVERAKAAHETIDLTVQGSLDKLAEHIHATEFIGYSQATATAKVEVLLVDGVVQEEAEAGTEVQIVLDKTPFYAESGGQIGDRGYISGDGIVVQVEDVKKESDFFVHFGRIERGTLRVGDSVTAQIDRAGRRRAQANHTATHLLQAALKTIVDGGISQAGSLVSFDRLRFDFNSPRGLTAEEIQQVEEQINTWIAEAHSAKIEVLPLAEAKARGAVAMFGEKYGDEVRVIDFPGVSMELCGGTHVSNTAEIGVFKIISEAGVASGVRRIEAVSGLAVLDYLNVRDKVVKDLSDRFKVKPEELPERITTLQNELRTTEKQLETLKGQLAIAKSDSLLQTADTLGDHKIIVAQLEGVDPESLKSAAERLLQKIGNGAVVLGSVPEADKVSLVAAFSPEVNKKGLQAGKFIGAIAKICGGGGGGRPNLAQAGGRDASKLPTALEQAQSELKSALG